MNSINKECSIKIDGSLMSYVEALHFDFIAYEHIMKNILLKYKDSNQYVYDENTCKIFIDKYREIYKKYNVTKMEILREYIPEQYKNDTFEFDFESGCVVLVNNECEGDSCGCGR